MPFISVSHANTDAFTVAAADQPQFRVRILGGTLASASAVTVKFQSRGTTNTDVTGAMTINTAVGSTLSFAPAPAAAGRRPAHVQGLPGETLVMILGGAVQVSGVLEYDVCVSG